MTEAQQDWYRHQAEHHGGVAIYNVLMAFRLRSDLSARQAYINARLAAHFARLLAGQS